ncbi:hypothetical protein [Alkalihalobacillus trypoxylicola]|uniref:Uncharacterized protein n=1 Tax=Alkalihalobacillus trypoxylicola TaxID=519424 RepID=A0A161PYH9_9BACI|nr:hypothetical protein [Alkalihalobacillus trypoxylicola]KYG27614.1 hypothetical protein AZF04_10495 [Alkalihalobacillus trypoxylicola]
MNKSLGQLMLKPASFKEWIICLIGWLIVIGIVVSSVYFEKVYRAAVLLFLSGFSYFVIQKLNFLIREQKQDKPLKNEEEKVGYTNIDKKEEAVSNTKIFTPAEDVKQADLDSATLIFNSKVKEKEEELEKIDLDRTQLLEDLFSKADLDELEKETYRKKIKEKDAEQKTILDEMVNAKTKIQQAFLDTKNIFVKEDPMKPLIAAINTEVMEDYSIQAMNEQLNRIKGSLDIDVITFLESENYVDDQFKLTRTGYKALLKYIK